MYSIEVKASSGSYPIYIKKGLLGEIGSEVKKIYKGRKIAIVTDSNVNKYYGEKVINSLNQKVLRRLKLWLKLGKKASPLKLF